ncbi:MAG: hypothetical protein RL501_180 [Bacteroidota bacterium]|jgi:hypothetical protein
MKNRLFFGLILLVLTTQSVDAQCAMCRAVLESEADNSMAKGINDGIVYLMAIPYLLVGAVFFAVYRQLKLSKKKSQTS